MTGRLPRTVQRALRRTSPVAEPASSGRSAIFCSPSARLEAEVRSVASRLCNDLRQRCRLLAENASRHACEIWFRARGPLKLRSPLRICTNSPTTHPHFQVRSSFTGSSFPRSALIGPRFGSWNFAGSSAKVLRSKMKLRPGDMCAVADKGSHAFA